MKSYLDRWLTFLIGTFYLFILIKAIKEFRGATTLYGDVLWIVSLKWKIFYFCLYLAIPIVLVMMIRVVLPLGKLFQVIDHQVQFLRRFSLTGFACLLVVTGLVWLITLSGFNFAFSGLYLRMALLLPMVYISAWFSPWPQKANFVTRFGLWLVGSMCLFLILNRLTRVTDYVFSLDWSEGNNLWMYSTLFSNRPDLVKAAYFPKIMPAAYGLYGLWFLIPGVPIWFHRLWLALLDIVPPFFLMMAVFSPLSNKPLKLGGIFWGVLFINQGPVYVYPPLIIAGAMVVAVRTKNLLPRIVAVMFASYFAAASRWTWLFAPAYWSVLIEFFYYFPDRPGSMRRKLLPALLLGMAGISVGTLYVSTNSDLIRDITTKAGEPLLWYRIFPSATSGDGLLVSSLVAFGPLLVFISWLVINNRWKLDRIGQILVFSGLFFTYTIGLLVSTKIGGGDNLHNFDMFIITLLILTGALIVKLEPIVLDPMSLNYNFSLSSLVGGLLLLVILIVTPCWFTVNTPSMLPRLPEPNVTSSQLERIRTAIGYVSQKGEILFITQRQLLIFNNIKDVKSVDSYEKVLLMEHAMAGDAAYFQSFYNDLKSHRFIMIVADPLPEEYQGKKHEFGEENDAWIKWVVVPVMENYKLEINFYPDFNLWLLIPNDTE